MSYAKYTGGKLFISKDCRTGYVISGNMKQHTSIHNREKKYLAAKSLVKDFTGKSSKDTYGNTYWRQTFYLLGVLGSIFPNWSYEETYANAYWRRIFPK